MVAQYISTNILFNSINIYGGTHTTFKHAYTHSCSSLSFSFDLFSEGHRNFISSFVRPSIVVLRPIPSYKWKMFCISLNDLVSFLSSAQSCVQRGICRNFHSLSFRIHTDAHGFLMIWLVIMFHSLSLSSSRRDVHFLQMYCIKCQQMLFKLLSSFSFRSIHLWMIPSREGEGPLHTDANVIIITTSELNGMYMLYIDYVYKPTPTVCALHWKWATHIYTSPYRWRERRREKKQSIHMSMYNKCKLEHAH